MPPHPKERSGPTRDTDWAGAGLTRWPCLGLALAAMLGITLDKVSDASWHAWSAPALAALGGWLVSRGRSFHAGSLWLLVGVVFFFAAWHDLRVDSAPGRRLALHLDGLLPAPATAIGIVADDPVVSKNDPRRATLTVRLENLETAGLTSRAPARARVAWTGEQPRYGDRVRVSARIERIPAARNPGEFDAAAFFSGRGIFHQIILKHPWEGEIIARGRGNPLVAASHAARRWMLDVLARGIEGAPDAVGVIAGMVLGERGSQPPEMRRMFRETGTLHLFAVSGLHVWMFGLLAWLVIRWLCPVKRRALLILIPLLVFYAAVTGFRPSVMRATIMAVVVLGGLLVERPPAMPNSLAAAALLILGIDPAQLFDLGFQLSFCVVASIALLASPISRLLGDWWVPDPFIPKKLLTPIQRGWQVTGGKVTGAIAVTLAAWLGSLPLIYGHFHLLSPVALLANLVAVGIGFAVLGLGLLSVALALVAPPLSVAANFANLIVATALLAVVKSAWLVPGGALYLVPPWERAGAPRVTVFDFGDGAAVHIEAGGQHALIDAGSASDAEHALSNHLRRRGAHAIAEIIVTHGDSQHVGGVPVLLGEFSVRSMSQSMTRDRSSARRAASAAAIKQGIPFPARLPGESITPLPKMDFDFLDPPGGIDERKADDEALVVRVTSRGWRMLFLGDAGFKAVQRMTGDDTLRSRLAADIVVLGWHQTDPHGVAEFLLEHVSPKLVIIADNPFARDPEAAERLAGAIGARGIHVADQRHSGAVILNLHHDALQITEFLTGRDISLDAMQSHGN